MPISALLAAYDNLILDLDGTVWVSDQPTPRAAEAIASIRSAIETQLPSVRLTTPPLAAVERHEFAPVDGFSVEETFAMRRAFEALGAFVRRVGLGTDGGLLRDPEYYRARSFLALDANTRKHLDLTKSQGQNPKATLLATIDRFHALGMDGVEAFYITHTRENTELIAKRCAELGMLTTGSADFHGPENRQFSKFMAFDTFGIEPNLGPIG